jgi:phosphoserine phosphatase
MLVQIEEGFMKKAFLFDLDGTITKKEILPCLASEIGISNEMAVLTKITLEGLISFEDSFRLRCFILSRIDLDVIQNIINNVACDEDIVNFIKSNKENTFVVTGNLDIWVENKIKAWGCNLISSQGIYQNDSLVLKKILNKKDAVKQIRDLGFEQVISIGDSHNDVPMFQDSDISIAFGGVHSPTRYAVENSNLLVFRGDKLCTILNMLL